MEVLATLGKADVALRIGDACNWLVLTDSGAGLHSTRVALSIMLDCGLISKALIQVPSESDNHGVYTTGLHKDSTFLE